MSDLDELARATERPWGRRPPAPPSTGTHPLMVGGIAAGVLGFLLLMMGVLYRGAPDVGGSRPAAASKQALASMPAGHQRPEVTTDAQRMVEAYQVNEVAADREYRGRVVQVSGVVEMIHRDLKDRPFVTLEGSGLRSVQCYFLPEVSEVDLAGLKPGYFLTVRGRCDGLWGNVQLRDCTMRK